MALKPHRAIIAALVLLVAGPFHAADEGATQQAAELFARAAELSDLRSPEAPPFQMRVRIYALADREQPMEGNNLLVWNSPSQWREEITLPGYARVRVGGEGKYWQKRSVNYEPLRVYEFSRLLDFQSNLRPDQIGRASCRERV